MRVFLTIVILVSLCLSAEALNVQSFLQRHRSLRQNKDKDAQTAVKAKVSPPAQPAQFKEQAKTATQTKAQAAAKTTTKTTTQTQAAAKATDKKAEGKTIEHITKEPPPPGMVRPVLVPPPDALPNTFKFKPIVEGQNAPARELHGNVFSPEFTEKGKSDSADHEQDAGWWHHHSHSMGPTVVEASEGKPGYIDTDSPNWPPKFPPCTGCEEQEQPPQCCMVMAQPPFSRGYWHAHGHLHIHHVHTPDESPEQMESEDAAAAQMEQDEDGEEEEDGEQQEEEDEEEPTPEEEAGATIDASTGGAMPAQPNEQDQLSSTAVEATTPTEGETSTAEDPVATVSVVERLINEAVLKSHDAIVTDMTAKLEEHKTAADKQIQDVQTHLESEIKGISDMLAKLIEKWGNPESGLGPKIVINNVHHHHHHDDDDDDDDYDDDSDDADVDATKFTSTAGSTIDLLRSMEAETESLTQKMDQADTLQSAADSSAADDDDTDDDDSDS